MSGTVQVVGRGPGTFTATRAGGGGPRGGGGPGTPAGGQPPAAAQPAASAFAGTWNVTINAAGQEIATTFVLEQRGERLTGRVESPFGTSDITDGSATGNAFRIATTANIGGQSTDITFEGSVSGNQVSGTVTSSRGTFPFSGTRTP
jgi:hypothetical protein